MGAARRAPMTIGSPDPDAAVGAKLDKQGSVESLQSSSSAFAHEGCKSDAKEGTQGLVRHLWAYRRWEMLSRYSSLQRVPSAT
jgi:hypothetical protein